MNAVLESFFSDDESSFPSFLSDGFSVPPPKRPPNEDVDDLKVKAGILPGVELCLEPKIALNPSAPVEARFDLGFSSGIVVETASSLVGTFLSSSAVKADVEMPPLEGEAREGEEEAEGEPFPVALSAGETPNEKVAGNCLETPEAKSGVEEVVSLAVDLFPKVKVDGNVLTRPDEGVAAGDDELFSTSFSCSVDDGALPKEKLEGKGFATLALSTVLFSLLPTEDVVVVVVSAPVVVVVSAPVVVVVVAEAKENFGAFGSADVTIFPKEKFTGKVDESSVFTPAPLLVPLLLPKVTVAGRDEDEGVAGEVAREEAGELAGGAGEPAGEGLCDDDGPKDSEDAAPFDLDGEEDEEEKENGIPDATFSPSLPNRLDAGALLLLLLLLLTSFVEESETGTSTAKTVFGGSGRGSTPKFHVRFDCGNGKVISAGVITGTAS